MSRAFRLWVTSAISRMPKPASATWSTSRAISAGSTRPCGHHQRKPAARRRARLAEAFSQAPGAARRWRCPTAVGGATAGCAGTAAVPRVAAAAPKSERRLRRGVGDGVGHGGAFREDGGGKGQGYGELSDAGLRGGPVEAGAGARSGVRRRNGGRGRASRRRSGRSAPSARPCTRTLPRAAASTGPASTGSPQASAVSWQSSSFCEPPPTTWTTSSGAPASAAAVRRCRR